MGGIIQPLLRFVNQGVFPFIGREQELLHLQQFSSKIGDTDSLQVLLLQGEAGVGKTRLLDESLPLLAENDATIIRAKFHNGTLCSSVSVLSDALRHSDSVRRIIKAESPTSLDFVISSIVRIAQVRRLIIIVEDIHLLADTALQEFAQIISALSDEPIGLLCASRLLDSKIRSIIEPSIVDEIHLRGWSNGEVTRLWRELFSNDFIEPGFIEQFQKNTDGNPLMIRMVLHSGVRSIFNKSGNPSTILPLQLDQLRIEQSIQSGKQLFAHGLAAHLSEEERLWAEKLATLGEIFSREAAVIILTNGEAALSRLQTKGIIIESLTQSEPINSSKKSSLPFIFTHTLLHKHFAEQKRFDSTRFWRVLAEGVPLYSIVAFELIEKNAEKLSVSNKLLLKGMTEMTRLVSYFTGLFDTAPKHKVHRALKAVAHARKGKIEAGEELEFRLLTVYSDVVVFQFRAFYHTMEQRKEYHELLMQYHELTGGDLPLELIHYRLNALGYILNYETSTSGTFPISIWEQIETCVDTQSELMTHSTYFSILSSVLSEIYRLSSRSLRKQTRPILLQIHKRVSEIALHADETTKAILQSKVYPQLMMMYEDAEELKRSKAMFNESLRCSTIDYTRLHKRLAGFAREHIEAESALTIAKNHLYQYELQEIVYPQSNIYTNWVNLLAAVNSPEDELIGACLYVEKQIGGKISSTIFLQLLLEFRSYAVMRCDEAWIKWLDQHINTIPDSGSFSGRFYEFLQYYHFQGTVRDNVPHLKKILASSRESGNLMNIAYCDYKKPVVELLAREVIERVTLVPPDDLADSIKVVLQEMFQSQTPSIDVLTILALLSHAEDEGISNLSQRLRPEIRSAMFRMMNWLIESKRIVFAKVYPQHFQRFFEGDEIDHWSQRIDKELVHQHQRLRYIETNLSSTVSLSMIGKVGFKYNGTGELQTIKGSRLKCILGLMVLDLILPKPLTRREFFDIAADQEQDEATKRNTVKVAVYQLRKLLGHDSIIQGKETPKLNPKYSRVDCVEIWNSLLKAEKALAKNKLNHARNSLLYVLRTLNGNVLFPTLYETIFETIREEFENRLRSIIIRICKLFSSIGDNDSCELILQLAESHLVGDEEIKDLLVDTLQSQHNYTGALRVQFASTAA
ncbi:MAG: AAA family ATPase [Candidatus Kapaibacterium sp.]